MEDSRLTERRHTILTAVLMSWVHKAIDLHLLFIFPTTLLCLWCKVPSVRDLPDLNKISQELAPLQHSARKSTSSTYDRLQSRSSKESDIIKFTDIEVGNHFRGSAIAMDYVMNKEYLLLACKLWPFQTACQQQKTCLRVLFGVIQGFPRSCMDVSWLKRPLLNLQAILTRYPDHKWDPNSPF